MNMIKGLHHITAITGNTRKNIRFYTEILGLELIKQTINYDSPDMWHLYFGNPEQMPGSVITFFLFQGSPKGKSGNGSVSATGLSIGEGSLDFWKERFHEYKVDYRGPFHRFDERYLVFNDFDGLELELVANSKDERTARENSGISKKNAIKGFHHVELSLYSTEKTASVFTDILEHKLLSEEGGRLRFCPAECKPGYFVDLVSRPSLPGQEAGRGTIHHIALGIEEERSQEKLREKVRKTGLFISPVIDRQYFKSVYFREPGGVLIEVATQGPGFLVDETIENLGKSLKLPPWLEPKRDVIERALPPLL